MRIKLAQEPKNYPWSSYKFFVSEVSSPVWLQTNFILSMLDKEFKKARILYRKFVIEHIGNEVDIIYSIAQHTLPLEVKSGQTITKDYFRGLNHFDKLFTELPYGKAIVYAGDSYHQQQETQILNPFKIYNYLKEKEI